MILDFKRTRSKPNTVSNLDERVEVVEEYRHRSVYLDSRRDWKAVYKKGHNRLYFLRKLGFFSVCTKTL